MKRVVLMVVGALGASGFGCGSQPVVEPVAIAETSGSETPPAPRLCPEPGDGRDAVLGADTPENQRADAALRQAHDATDVAGIEAALASLRADAGASSTHPWTAYAEGWMLNRMERWDEAAEAFGRAIRAHPSFDRAHLEMGGLHLRAERRAEASASYQRAIEANSGMTMAWYNLAQVHYLQENYEDALFEWGCALAIEPGDFGIQTKVVQTLHALDRFQDATEMRAQIRARWEAGELPGETSMIIDQFVVGGHRIYVRETFDLPAGELNYIYTFLVSKDDEVIRTVQLETSPGLTLNGIDSLMGTSADGTHSQLGVVFEERPTYESLRPVARGLIEDIQADRARATISSSTRP